MPESTKRVMNVIHNNNENSISSFEEDLLFIFQESLKAVDPCKSIYDSIRIKNNRFFVLQNSRIISEYNLNNFNKIITVGCGKAGSPMAQAVENILGDRIKKGSVVAVKYGYTIPQKLSRIKIIEAGHPIPDQNSLSAALEAKNLLNQADKNTLVLALISGGGSSLWTLPKKGITLRDKIKLTELLLSCGSDINEINYLRGSVSDIKCGNAAVAAFPATVIAFIVSDVINDNVSTIASGPFCYTNYYRLAEKAYQVIEKYNIKDKMPRNIFNYLYSKDLSLKLKEDSKEIIEMIPYKNNITHCICTNNNKILHGAGEVANKLNYNVIIINTKCYGESRNAAKDFVMEIKKTLNSKKFRNPTCIISGGETTVTLNKKPGRGGRNTEFVLAASLHLLNKLSDFSGNISLLSCGTDGSDGPTDAAGAMISLNNIKKFKNEFLLTAEKSLKSHDSYTFFEKFGGLIKTGPTNTNVMDIQIALINKIM